MPVSIVGIDLAKHVFCVPRAESGGWFLWLLLHLKEKETSARLVLPAICWALPAVRSDSSREQDGFELPVLFLKLRDDSPW